MAIRVTATDKDIGDFGNITYRLDDPQRIFTIDRYTVSIEWDAVDRNVDNGKFTLFKMITFWFVNDLTS